MANSNIPNVSVYVPVIQLNNTTYLEDGVLKPQTLNVPCHDVHIDTPYYWAVPIKDYGLFTGLQFIPSTDQFGNAVDQPTFDSFLVQRVRDKHSRYHWYIVIDAEASPPLDFSDVCAACCDDDAIVLSGTVPQIIPCQEICDSVNSEGEFISIFGAPALAEGQTYKANGSYNNEPLDEVTGADITTLIADMNATWTNIGSPPATFVWTNNGTVVTATGGFENDQLCVLIEIVET